MPPMRHPKGVMKKAKNPKKTLARLLGYMKPYTLNLITVMLCIVVSAFAQTRGSENIGNLVDDYILPMVASGSTDFSPLVNYLIGIAAVFACGMIASFLAQGYPAQDAAVCGVYLHGAAADFLKETFSEHGMLPSDLPLAVARILKEYETIA